MTLTEPAAGYRQGQLGSEERPHVRVLTDRCAGCQECVIRCPAGALSMDSTRWVAKGDDETCVGCRQCVRTCPFSAIVVEGPMLVAPRNEPTTHHELRLGDTSEIRSGFASLEEAMAEASRCLSCPDPTCVRGCPAHNDIPGFVGAVAQGNLEQAASLLRRTSVLSEVCSRVCNQAAQCEGACSWALAGGKPVAIGRLERFVADQVPSAPPVAPPEAPELSVAVVGAGPAGAGAAWELLEAGASVTVYEQDALPGGLCRWGIPDFTLPPAHAKRVWDQLVEAGVELHCSTTVTPAMLQDLLGEHDAVILANGATKPLRPGIPGAELEGVTDATVFLKGGKAALAEGGNPVGFLSGLGLDPARGGTRVLVLGAGNTAMDVARTARRLGLEATCVDWLDERFALARPDEIAEARAEGVEIAFSRTLARILGEGGRVAKAELARTVQGRADHQPKVLGDPPEPLEVDLVVMAMGYRSDGSFSEAAPGLPLRRVATGVPDRHWSASGILAAPSAAGRPSVGVLALGREVGLTAASLPASARVWVAGDALVGPSTVVEAMAQGRRAAAAVVGARPRRPGRAGRPEGTRVLVCYESQGGHTARAAEAIAASLSRRGLSVRALPIGKVGPTELASADLLVAGTWVEGLVVAGVRPAKAMRAWLDHLPRLGGKQVAVFCTYAVNPRSALSELREAFEVRGATVLADAAFGPRATLAGVKASAPAVFGQQLARLVRSQAAKAS